MELDQAIEMTGISLAVFGGKAAVQKKFVAAFKKRRQELGMTNDDLDADIECVRMVTGDEDDGLFSLKSAQFEENPELLTTISAIGAMLSLHLNGSDIFKEAPLVTFLKENHGFSRFCKTGGFNPRIVMRKINGKFKIHPFIFSNIAWIVISIWNFEDGVEDLKRHQTQMAELVHEIGLDSKK